MPRRDRSFGAAASLLASAFLLGASCVANAAADCLAKPDRQAAPGSHWSYRIDGATHRKCWYLKQREAAASAALQAAAPRQDAESQPQLLSWLSSAITAITRPAAPAPEQDATARESNPSEAARKRKLAKRPESGRERSSAQPAAGSSVASAPSLDPAASEALYQEFLQWRVKQLLAPELPPDPPARSPALSR